MSRPVRALLAVPWLLAGGLALAVGHAIYGRGLGGAR